MFNTQVTYVLPIDAEAGKFIYMATAGTVIT